MLLLFAWFGSSALAHATIVLGSLTSEPGVPQPDTPLTLVIELTDPAQLPVEDAWVLAEFRPESASARSEPLSTRFEESAPGRYKASVTLPEAGDWQLRLRDQTFRQEEATADLSFTVGENASGATLSFLFPPTATGSRTLTTWLLWLIVLPIAAGVLITIVVLRRPADEVTA